MDRGRGKGREWIGAETRGGNGWRHRQGEGIDGGRDKGRE